MLFYNMCYNEIMNKLILIFLCFFVLNSVNAVSFYDSNDTSASEILYNYILTENNWPRIFANQEFGISKENTYAIFADLNSDGENEIIGFSDVSMMRGTQGALLYILTCRNNGYKNIAYNINFHPQLGIEILDSKRHRFKDLKVNFLNNSKDFMVLRFNGKNYVFIK